MFRSQHTEMPGAAREVAQRDRWVLLREGVAGAARRTRRGRWVLACPLCRRNLPVEERELFRLLDAHHFAGMELEPGAPFRPGRRTWDTTVDLAAILRARG
ncbi:hypothetical protein [Pseudonocardia alni]|uniref:Uncharacterized protein n=1 Tax=Pseudonocardia alni TaxID=33907 RepID=A0A852W0H7_PSEA5|nr:hypothetical protein [Pseudonocardia antarctica]NYG00374.1 hypothetical protein [Pseudonocardia antarctica]